jgi:uncharacterized membrane protein
MLRSNRTHLLTLLAVTALAFALRLAWLPDANIWWDEGLAVWAARQSPLEIARWTSADVHPPLYFWLLHGWRLLVGDSEFAVRFLSVGLGTLTVAALWSLGRALLPRSRWIPLVAALLVATSRFLVWWSQEARMYMLGGLLATLSLYFTVRLRWRPTRAALVGYLLTTIAALWTLYLLAFLLVVQGLYWLWTLRHYENWQERGRALLRWAALQITVLLAFAPWLLYALPRMRSWSVQTAFDPRLYLELYATLLALGTSTNIEQVRLPVLLVVALVVFAFASRLLPRPSRAPQRDGLLLLLLALAIPPLTVWAVTMLPRDFGYLPKPEARYLLPFAPAFALLLAWSVGQFKMQNAKCKTNSVIQTGMVVGLVALSLWSLGDYYAGRYRQDDYSSIAATLRAHHQPGDGIVLHTDDPWPVFAYHWPGEWVGTPHLQQADAGGADYFLAPLWQAHDALWLVVNEDALRADPQRHFEAWLSERALAQHEWRFGPRRLLLFARTPERAESLLALAPGFRPSAPPLLVSDRLALVGWEQPLRRLRAGDVAHIAATVDRQGAGGALELWLDGLPETRTQALIPYGVGPVRLTFSIPIPPNAEGGSHPIRARLGSQEAPVGTVQLIAAASAAPSLANASPQHPLEATWGAPPLIQLLGYDLDTSQPNEVRLTLYWRVLDTPPLSYKVFTHLVNAEGRVAAQRDDLPLGGTRPTTTWTPGEVITDSYTITVGPEAPPGTYTLAIGFYDAATGTRLAPVLDESGTPQPNDQLRLGSVTVGRE